MLHGIFLFAARAWTQLTSAILLLLAARILDPASIGVFSLASALSMVLTHWVGVGTYEYVIRERHDREAASTAFWANMGVAVILAALGFGIADLSAAWFRTDALPPLIAALVPLTLPAGCRSTAEAVMLRDGRISRLATCTTIVETLGLAAGVAALFSGFGVWSLVVHKWTQSLTSAVIFLIAAKWLPEARFNTATGRKILNFGAGIFGDRFISYLQMYGVDLVLGALLNPTAVAVYRLSARLVLAVTTVILEPMRQLSWKHLSDTAAQGRSIPKAAEELIGILYAILAGPLVGIAVLSDLIVEVVLGPKWAACTPVVSLLALAPLLAVPQLLSESTLGTLGKVKWLPVLRALSVVLMFGALTVFIGYGPLGAAASQLVAAAIVIVITMFAQSRLAGIRVTGYLRGAGFSLLSAGLMAVSLYGLKDVFHNGDVPLVVRLGTSVLAGGAIYLGCVGLLFRAHLRAAWQSIHG